MPIRVRIGPLSARFGRRFESDSVFESAIRFGHRISYPIRIPNRVSDSDTESGIRFGYRIGYPIWIQIGLNSEHKNVGLDRIAIRIQVLIPIRIPIRILIRISIRIPNWIPIRDPIWYVSPNLWIWKIRHFAFGCKRSPIQVCWFLAMLLNFLEQSLTGSVNEL